MTEATTSATCRFDEIHVELVSSKIFAPKTLETTAIEATWKYLFMSSGYKIAWKDVTLVECRHEEDGDCLRLETTKFHFSCHQHDIHARPFSVDWPKCLKLVEHIWKKKQRKLEKQKEKQELLERQNNKKQKKVSTSWQRKNTKSNYSKRPLKFLMANQNNNQWDSEDDDDDEDGGVFNQGGHKKRRQEQQQPVDLDEQLLQEESAERAVEDMDLQEMEQERELQEEELPQVR